jgi:serine/threonine protein kinase
VSVPQVLGAYQMKGKLAVGGQSEVWLGLHRGPGGFRRLCALKLVLPPASLDDVVRKNFFAEARLMAQFDHPNLVAMTDLGIDEETDILFAAMPYVSGRSLATLMRDGSVDFDLPDVLWIISRVLLALHYAHELSDDKGRHLAVIHRDVSPENILIGFEGGVRLVDFGIALSSINPRSTRMHVVKGKLEYLSPEQASAVPRITVGTDIYSAGLVLYSLLTGTNPLSGNPDTALARARNPKIRPLSDFRAFPIDLEPVVFEMLHVDPQRRPTDALKLARTLVTMLRRADPNYDEYSFTETSKRILRPHLAGERQFLMELQSEGTQVIDTRAAVGVESPPRRKTIPARMHQKTPVFEEKKEEDLDDIFRELEEIYED